MIACVYKPDSLLTNNDQQAMGITAEAKSIILGHQQILVFLFLWRRWRYAEVTIFFRIYRTPRLYLCDESRLSQSLGEKLSLYIQNMLLGLKDSTETFDKRIVNILSLINSKLKNIYGAH